MFRETVVHLRDLPRYRQILATLIRYGYWDVVRALRIEGVVGPIERALGETAPPSSRPERIRRVCVMMEACPHQARRPPASETPSA